MLDLTLTASLLAVNIACFTVDAANTIHFLRPRGVSDSPIKSVYHGVTYGKRLCVTCRSRYKNARDWEAVAAAEGAVSRRATTAGRSVADARAAQPELG